MPNQPADQASPEIDPPKLDPLTPELRVQLPSNWPLLAIAGIAVAAGAWWFVAGGRHQDADDPARQEATQMMEQLLRKSNQLGEHETLATRRIAWEEVRATLALAEGSLDKLDRERAEHQTLLDKLLDSDEGRRIAASPAHVTQYRALLQQSGVGAEMAVQRRDAHGRLRRVIEDAFAAEPILKLPTEEFAMQVAAYQKSVAADLQQLQQQRRQLAELVAQASSAGPGSPLREVIAGLENQEAAPTTRRWRSNGRCGNKKCGAAIGR